MRTPLIAGNFKMFKTAAETAAYVVELRELLKDVRGVDVVIAPPFTALHAAAGAAAGSAIGVGAQNVHWERDGAFTGEVSAGMIRETGARFVIVGHSERRTLFGETNATVNKKMNAVIAAGLTPIVCIGETLEQRDRNETLAVLDRQIKEGLDGATGEQLAGMVLAFARALGEFGATLTFAGSREGVTRTLPLEIYLQRESDPEAAVALSVLLVVVAAVVVVGLGSRRLRAGGANAW